MCTAQPRGKLLSQAVVVVVDNAKSTRSKAFDRSTHLNQNHQCTYIHKINNFPPPLPPPTTTTTRPFNKDKKRRKKKSLFFFKILIFILAYEEEALEWQNRAVAQETKNELLSPSFVRVLKSKQR